MRAVVKRIDILGVKISKVSYISAIEIVEGFLVDGEKHYIVTPNPEFVVLAQSDREFREILNRADLAIPDGVGLRMGTRVTGTDLMIRLCELASQRGYSVFLLGGEGGVAEEAAKRLKKQFANLNIVGTYEGDFPEGIKTADFLFVAYGAPKQEKWIAQNLSKIPVRVAMGVGGAFDFIAGKKKRAPLVLRRLGFEWLWRLIQEPQRLPRILNATIKFPFLVFLHKLSQTHAKQ